MGEYADMAINGDMCETCGEVFHTAGQGFPRRCASCKREDRGQSYHEKQAHKPSRPEKTPPVFEPRHKKLGFQICSPWHWQARLPGGRVNWWPSATKWQYGSKIYEGKEEVLVAFIMDLQGAAAAPPPCGRYPSPEEVEAAQVRVGAWAPEQLTAWGVPIPPAKGWRRRLEGAYLAQQRAETARD